MSARVVGIVAMCVVVAATAQAELDVSIRNGDTVRGTLLPATETETFRFLCPQGAKIAVSAASRGTSMRVAATLVDPDDVVAAGAAGHRARLRSPGAASGEFRVEVSSADGITTGDYALTVRWRSPRTFARTLAVDASSTADLAFAADAGARVTFAVAPARGSAAVPFVARVRAGDGTLFLLTPGPSATFDVPATGSYSLTFGNTGAAGDVDARAQVRVPRPGRRRLAATTREIPPGTDIVAAAVVGTSGGVVTAPVTSPLARARVTIPAGALDRAAIVVLGTSADVVPPDPPSSTAATPPAFVGPLGRTFAAALPAVDLPLLPADDVSPEALLRVYESVPFADTGVVPGAGTVGQVVRLEPSRFARFQGWYVVGADGPPVLVPSVDEQMPERAAGPVAMGGGFAFVASLQRGDWSLSYTIGEGLVRVFERQGPAWVERGTLRSPLTTDMDSFGVSLAYRTSPLGPADDSLLVASRYANGRLAAQDDEQPAIFEFTRSGSEWTYLRQLPAVGTYVFSVDGDTLYALTSDYKGVDTFVRGPQGWSAPAPPRAFTHPINSIDVRGAQMLLGDWSPDPDGSHGSGSAFRYVLSGGSAFQAIRYDCPPPLQDFSWFGASVAMGANYAAVARMEYAPGVSMFRRSDDALDATLTIPVLPGYAGSPAKFSGFAMSGDTVVLGAGTEAAARPLVGGFVFRRASGTWTHRYTLDAAAALGLVSYDRAQLGGIAFDGTTAVASIGVHVHHVGDRMTVAFFDVPPP